MRTFIIKARKGTTRWQRVRSQVGGKEHFEVIAHSVINAFFVSSDFRTDVEVYIVLDSTEDFPRTIHLSSAQGLSLAGFHEDAIVSLFEQVLKNSQGLQKDDKKTIAPGVIVYGFGFERLIASLPSNSTLYLLDKKGQDIRTTALASNPVFLLSDHLVMPKKTVAGLKRKGLELLSLGHKMLFASQCIVLINHELDRGA